MCKDPIVEEVRKHRQARAAKFNYDLDAMVADVRSREKTSGHKLASPRKRRTTSRGAGAGSVPGNQ